MPFHCVCDSRDGNPFASPTVIEQWGRVGEEAELERVFDPWTGSTGDLYHQENTPWKAGAASFVVSCMDHRGVVRWCWTDEIEPVAGRPLLPRGQNCAAYGAQLGQTMAYVVIHMGEILSLATYRTEGFFLPQFFSNPVYTGFLVCNLTMLMMFLYLPVLTTALQLAPLGPLRLSISVFFACCVVVLNELAKIAYRSEKRKEEKVQFQAALERSRGNCRLKNALEKASHDQQLEQRAIQRMRTALGQRRASVRKQEEEADPDIRNRMAKRLQRAVRARREGRTS